MTPTPPDHDAEDALAIQRRRVRYRSWHRGCKETDVILGNFANDALETLDIEQGELNLYEDLLAEQDIDIWNWLSGDAPLGNGRYDRLRERLRFYARCA